MTDFGMKELYSVTLKATSDMEINGVHFQENEPILEFDKIQISFTNENKRRVSARGGFGNQTLITWENTPSISIEFTEGVLSKLGLSFLSNSKIFTYKNQDLIIPYSEKIEIQNEEGIYKIRTRYDVEGNLFLRTNRKRIENFELQEDKRTIIINSALDPEMEECIAYYDYKYNQTFDNLSVGCRAVKGFLKLVGRVRLKDDQTGKESTMLLEIPKFKLLSDLTLRLGSNVTPYIYTFRGEGYPVGERGSQYVCRLTFLSNDIDADF